MPAIISLPDADLPGGRSVLRSSRQTSLPNNLSVCPVSICDRLAMATYEWIAALGLIIVAKYFIPIFLEKKIFTMPQFLEERFDKRVKTVMAVFWLAVLSLST